MPERHLQRLDFVSMLSAYVTLWLSAQQLLTESWLAVLR